jgi:hypothetical protein
MAAVRLSLSWPLPKRAMLSQYLPFLPSSLCPMREDYLSLNHRMRARLGIEQCGEHVSQIAVERHMVSEDACERRARLPLVPGVLFEIYFLVKPAFVFFKESTEQDSR